MAETLKCSANDRRKQIDKSNLNGIDYIEVVTPDETKDATRRPYLLVYFFKPLKNNSKKLGKDNVRIEGGVKVKNIRIERAEPYEDIAAEILGVYPVDEDSKSKVLVVYPSTDGDFSLYTLRIVTSIASNHPPDGFDLLLSSITFSFKIDYPSNFDYKPNTLQFHEVVQEPVIDYLSKDYASFRQLVLNRLSSIVPYWKERNIADMSIMMAEMLAYVGDYLSYYQDAVATEAYLGTSRRRISVKRHARLLDYYMHNGCNARAWLCIQTNSTFTVPKRTKFLTGMGDGGSVVIEEDELETELSQGAQVFEAMHDLTLHKAHNCMGFYTWGNSNYCLPKGSTQATLYATNNNGSLVLKTGDVLIFEETHSSAGIVEDKDVSNRHAVRLINVKTNNDALFGEDNPIKLIDIEWAVEDALPFSLRLTREKSPVAAAYGNVLLVDHGLSLKAEKLVDPDIRTSFRPRLNNKSLTFKGPFDVSVPASTAFDYDLQDVKADIYLRQLREVPKNEFDEPTEKDWLPGTWVPQHDLFSSNKFKTDFVVETENDGTAILRFGDGVHGLNPQEILCEAPKRFLYAFYRVGNGSEGNVGSDSIKRIIHKGLSAEDILSIRNPMPAKGGVDPESIATVRQNAPEVAKINERAVTGTDYADIIKQKCSDVQRAVARVHWTGSWHTIYVIVDRFGGQPVDEPFKIKLKNILNQYRLSGYDVEIVAPIYVPLEIEVNVNVSPDSLPAEVKKTLMEVFSSRVLPNGLKGFFHPDNFTFGQSVFLSLISVAIAKVEGVLSSEVTLFRRTDKDYGTDKNYDTVELSTGVIAIGPYEIIQLENDVNYPERGRIKFVMKGGR